jgi:hypothetical protein
MVLLMYNARFLKPEQVPELSRRLTAFSRKAGLARALARLEYSWPSLFMGIFSPGKKTDLPSVLRTHPATRDRIERLISLAEDIKGRYGRGHVSDCLDQQMMLPGLKSGPRDGLQRLVFFANKQP